MKRVRNHLRRGGEKKINSVCFVAQERDFRVISVPRVVAGFKLVRLATRESEVNSARTV